MLQGMSKQAWNNVNERTVVKCFYKAGFLKKESQAVNVGENFDENDPRLAVDYCDDKF